MSIEELKNKAERYWVECDGCNQDDRQMWISGYLAGALSNQIELPSDDELEEISKHEILYNDSKRGWWLEGASYILNLIKLQYEKDN